MPARLAKKGLRRPAKKAKSRSMSPKKELPPRQSWVFVDAAMDKEHEERQVRALEFIAHYLDRIELQLARVADAVEFAMLED